MQASRTDVRLVLRSHAASLMGWTMRCCAGGVLATKQEIRPYPTRTNQIPRHVPPPHWASHPWVLFLAAGLLPYGTLFVELYFAMTSIWQVGLQHCSAWSALPAFLS